MLKKKAISLVMSVLMAFSLCGNAFAVSENSNINVINASAYLSTYNVALSAQADHRMAIGVTVTGTSIMDKIGVSIIDIDQKINGVWSDYNTLYALYNPNFYQYNTTSYVDTISFYGTQGVQYRVSLTVYAGKGSGSDTGILTSYTVTCK
ncbi:MAG: hypothetical protein VB064_13195 [Oscillospiraceae bacterium]|nr:hypothetical protein [Oscillospiraceae bacterium]